MPIELTGRAAGSIFTWGTWRFDFVRVKNSRDPDSVMTCKMVSSNASLGGCEELRVPLAGSQRLDRRTAAWSLGGGRFRRIFLLGRGHRRRSPQIFSDLLDHWTSGPLEDKQILWSFPRRRINRKVFGQKS